MQNSTGSDDVGLKQSNKAPTRGGEPGDVTSLGGRWRGGSLALASFNAAPYTVHPTPYNLHPTPCTQLKEGLGVEPHTLYPAPCTPKEGLGVEKRV